MTNNQEQARYYRQWRAFLRPNIQADQPRKHKINRKPLNFKN
nr:MAG TPA: hypothetical protein [Caudoviricetes sp.]